MWLTQSTVYILNSLFSCMIVTQYLKQESMLWESISKEKSLCKLKYIFLIETRIFCITLPHAVSRFHASLLTARVLLCLFLREHLTAWAVCVLPCLNNQGHLHSKTQQEEFFSFTFFNWCLNSLVNEISEHCEFSAFGFNFKYIWFEFA